MKFIKKRIEIDAIRFTGYNHKEIFEFTNINFPMYPLLDTIKGEMYEAIIIPTLEGNHHLTIGNWLIKGIKGEFYPCRDDVFIETYDLVINNDTK